MHGLANDLRFTLRSLRRRPGFTAAAVGLLALGIGAATAVFSVLHAVVLAPLPYPAADRLVRVWETDPHNDSFRENASGPDFTDFREQATSFARLAAASFPEMNLRPAAGPPLRVAVAAATPELLALLGAEPFAGRLLGAADDRPGGPRVAVLGHALWQRAFGGDLEVVGRTIELDGLPYEVVGVLPRGFTWNDRELWLPLHAATPFLDVRGVHNLGVFGLLRPGVSLAQAEEEMQAIAAGLAERHPQDNRGRGVQLEPLKEAMVGDASREVWVLFAAVALVLLVACANVAGLWLVRAHGRRRELAVRAALGAGRRRLASQLLAEALFVAAAGGLLGLLVARGALALLLALRPEELPRAAEVGLHGGAALFAAGAALLTGLLFGAAPLALAGERRRLSGLGGRGESRGMRRPARAALVIAEVALALVLVTGAGLLGRSFWRLLAVDPGFAPQGIVSFDLALPDGRYPMPPRAEYPRWPQVLAAYERIEERLAAIPGVEGVAFAVNGPLEAGFTSQLGIVGRPEADGPRDEARIRPVTPGYHRMLSIPLRRGRFLAAADGQSAPDVLLVNEAFVRRYFPAEDPVGRSVSFWGRERRIVGVVGDVRFTGLEKPSEPALYPPLAQVPFSGVEVLAASPLPASALVPQLRRAMAELEPDVALAAAGPLTDGLRTALGERRFLLALLGGFGGVTLLLAAVGIYGLVAFQVAQRRHELGIRQVLGAGPRAVTGEALREGVVLVGAGIIVGLAGAAAASRGLAGLLYEVPPLDPGAFLGAAGVLAAVALLAAWLPARRAARLDLASVLRSEQP